MDRLGRVLAEHTPEDLSSIPDLGGKDRRISGTHWLTSLVNWLALRFKEILLFCKCKIELGGG